MDGAYTLSGLVVGFLAGLTGIGAGALITFAGARFGVSPAVAAGTDLLYAVITKSAGAWIYARKKHVDWRMAGMLATGSVPAAVLTLAAMKNFNLEGPQFSGFVTIALGVLVTVTSVGAGAMGIAVLSALSAASGYNPGWQRHCARDTADIGRRAWSCCARDRRFQLLVSLLAGPLPGIYLGSHAAGRMPERVLRYRLASVLLIGGRLVL